MQKAGVETSVEAILDEHTDWLHRQVLNTLIDSRVHLKVLLIYKGLSASNHWRCYEWETKYSNLREK